MFLKLLSPLLLLGLYLQQEYFRSKDGHPTDETGSPATPTDGPGPADPTTAEPGPAEDPTAELESEAPPTAEVASTPERDPSAPDDFTTIRGIGPRTAERLQAGGITTFSQLAEASEDRLIDLVGGPRMSLSTWPEQARLAAAGDLQALEAFQEDL